MATIPSFTSTTLEGAFLEAAFLLQKGEINFHLAGKDKSGDPDKPGVDESLTKRYINILIDTDQQRAIINATVPVASAPNSFGGYFIAYQFVENADLSSNFDAVNTFYKKNAA